MEIQVGDYVRIKSGDIGRVKTIHNHELGLKSYDLDSGNLAIDSTIVKHSKNIIDLIEVGDIVRILLNEKTRETAIFRLESQKQVDILDEQNSHIIKSIVTHEQFKQTEYVI